jgi:muramoyltetrapeptide carboxypeptidase
MTRCCEPGEEALLDATLLHALREFDGPIGIGLRSGHVDAGNITLPFGVEVRLDFQDAGNPRMHFVEASVTV